MAGLDHPTHDRQHLLDPAAPQGAVESGRDVTEADFLQPGATQVAAGYALYGPTTMFVLTVGNGVAGYGTPAARAVDMT